jgi:hypothetical protein
MSEQERQRELEEELEQRANEALMELTGRKGSPRS